jgi:hypothetical protein
MPQYNRIENNILHPTTTELSRKHEETGTLKEWKAKQILQRKARGEWI